MPFAAPRTTLACSHRSKPSDEPIDTGVPWPMGVGVTDVATPAGVSPDFCTSSGMPPGQLDEASRNRRSLNT